MNRTIIGLAVFCKSSPVVPEGGGPSVFTGHLRGVVRPTQGRWLMRRLTLLFAAAAALIALVASANAAGTTQITGLQAGDSACGDVLDGTYGMQGSLVGCWYTDTFVVSGSHPSGTFQASGTEHFIGCMNPQSACTASSRTYGTFSTTFTFSSKVDPTTGLEMHGRCHHPIVSGTGYFAGATGLLNFTDDVTQTPTVYPYKGHITIR
jgi:hypothetical protein